MVFVAFWLFLGVLGGFQCFLCFLADVGSQIVHIYLGLNIKQLL